MYCNSRYTEGVANLNVRTDTAMEAALAALTEQHGSRSDAVRYAVMHTYREAQIEQARADADRLAADADDRAEMLAIQRYMGVAE